RAGSAASGMTKRYRNGVAGHRRFVARPGQAPGNCARRPRHAPCEGRGGGGLSAWRIAMTYVIAEPCVGTCDTACVDVCPLDAIHGPVSVEEIRRAPGVDHAARLAGLQLYIDPEACICCGACEPVCPARAIFDEDELPAEWERYRAINAQFFEERTA